MNKCIYYIMYIFLLFGEIMKLLLLFDDDIIISNYDLLSY